jgi:hypothetical protein
MDISKLETSKKEIEGVWCEHGDAKFLVRSASNPAYKRALNDRLKPHLRTLRRGLLSDTTRDQITRDTMAEHILVGWTGLSSGAQAIEYSVAKAKELLDKYPKLVEIIAEFASDQSLFEEQAIEEGVESAKNG